jgi:uncharacterized membrane protein
MDNLTKLTFVGTAFVIVGLLLRFLTPNINRFYGYRTKTSMENQTNWDYSQKYSGGLFAIFGIALLIICVVIKYAEINVDNNSGNLAVGILIFSSVITTIVFTEKALKKHSEK